MSQEPSKIFIHETNPRVGQAVTFEGRVVGFDLEGNDHGVILVRLLPSTTDTLDMHSVLVFDPRTKLSRFGTFTLGAVPGSLLLPFDGGEPTRVPG